MTNQSDDTARRLLDAATAVFVEKGYADASVRAVTQRAGVNVAAVNYHFQDKAGLYIAVVRRQFDELTRRMPALPATNVPLDDYLAQLYRTLLADLSHTQADAFHRLMAREESAPSGVLSPIWAEVVKPRHDELAARLAHECGVDEPTADVHRLVKAVIDIGKGYVRDRVALAVIAPVLYAGDDWLDATVSSLVSQARDLIDGLRRRQSLNNKKNNQ